jgi:hypothetical protein
LLEYWCHAIFIDAEIHYYRQLSIFLRIFRHAIRVSLIRH